MRPLAVLPIAALALLPGCVARTVVDVATAPMRVAGRAVDLATTSQSEADEKRGREIREREERLGTLERRYSRHMRQCDAGDRDACEAAREEFEALQSLQTTAPAGRY